MESRITAVHRLGWRVEGIAGVEGVAPSFILKLLYHEDTFLFRFGTMKAKENCSWKLYPQHYTSAPPLAHGFSVHTVLVFQITFLRGHRQEMSTEVTACVAAGLHSQNWHNSSKSKYSITVNLLSLGSPLDDTNLGADIRFTAQFPWVMMLITSILKEQSKFISFPSAVRLHSRLPQESPWQVPELLWTFGSCRALCKG